MRAGLARFRKRLTVSSRPLPVGCIASMVD